MSICTRLCSSAALAACLAAASPAAAGDVRLTPRADRYVTKPGDWNVYARGGNDVILDDGRLADEHGNSWTIYGEDGNDTITGTIFARGGNGNDWIEVKWCSEDNGCSAYGDAGNDVLTARLPIFCPNDLTLNGGPGNDKLTVSPGTVCQSTFITGGPGRDVLVGVPVNPEVFVFYGGHSQRGPNHDIVRGFSLDGEDGDTINLSWGDANLLKAGKQHYTWGGTGRNPGVGQVSHYRVGADTYFVANNGKLPLLGVELDNLNAPLSAIDFVL